MFVTCINKDDDDDSEWAAFFVASCDHRGLPSPPPLLPPPPVPLIFQASEVKREAPDTCNGGRRTKKISLKKARRKRKVLRQ